MIQGLKKAFHKEKGGPNQLKDGRRGPGGGSDGAPHRVRLADVTDDESDSHRRSSQGSQVGLIPRASMESRPLPKRNLSQSGEPHPPETSTQALALAMLSESKELRADGSVKIASTVRASAEIMCCRFSSTGAHLAVGLVSGAMPVFDTDSAMAPVTLLQDADTLARTMPVTCARFVPVPETSASAILLSAYGDGLLKFWRYLTGECVQTLDVEEQILALSFDCLGKYFQIAGEDGVIRVFDVATAKLAGRLRASSNHALNDGHRSRVFALAPHPSTPHELLSAGWDNTVQFWDMRHPHAVRRIYGPHVCGEGLAIDPYTSHVATASWRRRQALQMWDYGSGELIADLQPDTNESMQTCAQFMGRGYLAASGGFVNVVRMIDLRSYMTCGIVRNLPLSVRCQDVVLFRSEKQFPRLAACCGTEVFLIDTWH